MYYVTFNDLLAFYDQVEALFFIYMFLACFVYDLIKSYLVEFIDKYYQSKHKKPFQ